MASATNTTPPRTIRDIAELAGVSIATVSRVINGRPDVAEETRDTVLRIVREYGFSTNRSARGLSGGRTGLIAVSVPLVHAAYFAQILGGATEALYEHDMRVVLCPTAHEHDREVTLLEHVLQGTTDGALIMLPQESSDELQALRNHGYDFVVVDPLTPLSEGIPSVSAAHASGAKQATRHLIELGHTRIAAITGPQGWMASEERLNGYHAAIAAAGLPWHNELEVQSDFASIEAGYGAAAALLDSPAPPTAIFAFNDNLAIGALQAARARSLRVPEDISIIGFDDSEMAPIVTPALTTVRQPLEEMGRMAVSVLLRLLDNQRLEALRVELATKLVVRDSTGPAAR